VIREAVAFRKKAHRTFSTNRPNPSVLNNLHFVLNDLGESGMALEDAAEVLKADCRYPARPF
jgi:hypothetical protein